MTQTPGARGHKTFCFWCSTGGRWEGSVSLLPWWRGIFPSGAAVLGAVRFSQIVPSGTRQHRTLLALWSGSSPAPAQTSLGGELTGEERQKRGVLGRVCPLGVLLPLSIGMLSQQESEGFVGRRRWGEGNFLSNEDKIEFSS